MARVVQYNEIGPAEVLEIIDVETPAPGPGQVLVEVRAAGVNPIDWKLRSGYRPLDPDAAPYRPGADAAGVVASVGPGVEDFSEGDPVVVVRASGTYATHLVLEPDQLAPLPSGLSFEQGAAVGIPAATAYQALASLGVDEGTTLLVHGGSGGVGQAAVQLARIAGAQVVATASPPNHERLRELGAVPVAYGPGLTDRVREAAPQGVDRVLDAVGTDEALLTSIELVDDPQQVATVVQGGRAAALGIQAYSGGSPEPLTAEQQQLRREAIPAVLGLAADNRYELEVGPRYALDDVVAAHRDSESGHVRGKIVLLP